MAAGGDDRPSITTMLGEPMRGTGLVWDVAIGYVVFLALALIVSLVAESGLVTFPVTLADLLSGNTGLAELGEPNARGTLLVLVTAATFAVPFFWKNRFAYFAYAVPLVVTLVAFWPFYEQHRARREAFEGLAELGSVLEPISEGMQEIAGSPFDSLGVGAYVLFAIVVYLSLRGVVRVFAR
jgi:hypothetical protein